MSEIKIEYYEDSIRKKESEDYIDDVEYLYTSVHLRKMSNGKTLWVDKINDKLYNTIFCSPEYLAHKMAEVRDEKINNLLNEED